MAAIAPRHAALRWTCSPARGPGSLGEDQLRSLRGAGRLLSLLLFELVLVSVLEVALEFVEVDELSVLAGIALFVELSVGAALFTLGAPSVLAGGGEFTSVAVLDELSVVALLGLGAL